MEARNPFDTLIKSTNSNYSKFNGEKLEHALNANQTLLSKIHFAHQQLRFMVLNKNFPCAGAKTAIHQNTYRFSFYSKIGSEETAKLMCFDLFNFILEQKTMDSDFTTFISVFETPIPVDEGNFENLLWKQLQMVHNYDMKHHKWNSNVSDDPDDKEFSFSFAERAFFIVGMHPASSRYSRRFVYPTLIFNSHEQFNNLKLKNKFERLQKIIRKNDKNLQGNINPNLTDFGEDSEAKQYSGKPITENWKCPFVSKSKKN